MADPASIWFLIGVVTYTVAGYGVVLWMHFWPERARLGVADAGDLTVKVALWPILLPIGIGLLLAKPRRRVLDVGDPAPDAPVEGAVVSVDPETNRIKAIFIP